MSIRINKKLLTPEDQTDYEKQAIPISITLRIAQVPAKDPNQPAQSSDSKSEEVME